MQLNDPLKIVINTYVCVCVIIILSIHKAWLVQENYAKTQIGMLVCKVN